MEAHDQLSERNFEMLASIVEGYAGIKLPQAKRTMVEGRLRRRVRQLGLAGLDDYAAHILNAEGGDDELVHLIDSVTTNKTDFFREPAHFDFLRMVAIPALVRSRGRQPAQIKLWSAACANGAEAFTIAMVLQDMQGQQDSFRYSILGTDISTEILAEATDAIYPRTMIEAVPPDKRQRYLMTSRDPARDLYRIVPELRRQVNFRRLNLMDETYPFDTDIDVIFCRNVLIYFERTTQQAVIGRLASHLRPGGYLMLGHSESMAGNGIAGLRQVHPTVFQVEASLRTVEA